MYYCVEWFKITFLFSFLLFKNVLYNLSLWVMTVFFHDDLSFDSVEKINLISYLMMGIYSLNIIESKKRIKTHFHEFDSLSLKNVFFFFILIIIYIFFKIGPYFYISFLRIINQTFFLYNLIAYTFILYFINKKYSIFGNFLLNVRSSLTYQFDVHLELLESRNLMKKFSHYFSKVFKKILYVLIKKILFILIRKI